MSNTRTVNELAQLLKKNNIEDRDGRLVKECEGFKDPETVDAMYQLVDAVHSSTVLSEDLKNKLGIEKSMNDLLLLISSTVSAIEEAHQAKQDKSGANGEALVKEVLRNLISIITLRPDNKILTDNTRTPEEKAAAIAEPLKKSLHHIQEALPDKPNIYLKDNVGDTIAKIIITFLTAALGLGGACMIGLGIAFPPLAPVALICAAMIFGVAGTFYKLSLELDPKKINEDVKKANAKKEDRNTVEMARARLFANADKGETAAPPPSKQSAQQPTKSAGK